MPIHETSCYKISKEVITREIEGEMVVVPIESGVGSLNSPIYSLNTTGAAIWTKLDGMTPLRGIIEQLAREFNTAAATIHDDVMEIMAEFEQMGLLIET